MKIAKSIELNFESVEPPKAEIQTYVVRTVGQFGLLAIAELMSFCKQHALMSKYLVKTDR